MEYLFTVIIRIHIERVEVLGTKTSVCLLLLPVQPVLVLLKRIGKHLFRNTCT